MPDPDPGQDKDGDDEIPTYTLHIFDAESRTQVQIKGDPIEMFWGPGDDTFFAIKKNFGIFGSLYEELTAGYVDPVDPEPQDEFDQRVNW